MLDSFLYWRFLVTDALSKTTLTSFTDRCFFVNTQMLSFFVTGPLFGNYFWLG